MGTEIRGKAFLLFSGRLIFIISLLTLLGCKQFTLGNYEGTLYWEGAERPLSLGITATHSVAITAERELSFKEKSLHPAAVVQVFNRNDRRLLYEMGVVQVNSQNLKLFLPNFRNEAFLLKRVSQRISTYSQVCFLHTSDWQIEFCYHSSEFKISLKDTRNGMNHFILSGLLQAESGTSNSDWDPPLKKEESLTYTLAEAVRQAKHKNFKVRESLNQVLESRTASVAAYASLAPHLNVSALWYTSPAPVSGVLAALSFVHFLLPSEWANAKMAQDEYKIKKWAQDIVKADTILNIENLFYAAVRDQNLMRFYSDLLRRMKVFLPWVSLLEKRQGNLVPAVKDWKQMVTEIDRGLSRMDFRIHQNRYAVALALGFNSSEAVLDFELGAEQEALDVKNGDTTFQIPSKRIPQEDAKAAWAFSREKHQYLLARKSRKCWERIKINTSFLSPGSSTTLMLGPGLYYQNRILDEKLESMQQEFAELHRDREFQAKQVADQYNFEMDSYISLKDVIENYILENKDLVSFFELTTEAASTETRESLLLNSYQNLIPVLQKYVSYRVELEGHLAEFRSARAAKDRLLHQGYQLEVGPSLFDVLPPTQPILVREDS